MPSTNDINKDFPLQQTRPNLIFLTVCTSEACLAPDPHDRNCKIQPGSEQNSAPGTQIKINIDGAQRKLNIGRVWIQKHG